MNKKIVVTGGAGFIGSHVVKLFCDNGFDVYVVDDLSFGFEKFVDKRAKFFKGKIQNGKLMDKILPGTFAVIHLAAFSIIKFSYKNPLSYFENNVTSGIKLLESMRKNKVKKIIFSSSASIYKESENPVTEDGEKSPKSPYGVSKLIFEEVLKTYYSNFGIESVSLRYFNAYGPNDEQIPHTRAVSVWIRALLSGRTVPLYWMGKQRRDYIYVEDIAMAHLKAMDLSGLHFINIGSGNGVLMIDLLKLLEKLTGRAAKVEDRGERLGDPQVLVADISKAKKILSWIPQISLEQGLKQTIDYYRNGK